LSVLAREGFEMGQNSDDAQRGTSFWKTIPGILTAISTLIGAVTGLVLAFHQIGFFKSVTPAPPSPAIVVPSVIKHDQKKAEALLVKGELRVGRIIPRAAAGVIPGTVLDQQPPSGTTVERNTPVDLVVAEEPARPVTVEVPSVVKRDQREAVAILEKSGFRVGNISTRAVRGVSPGFVLDQDPRGGIRVERNTAVHVVVAEAVASSKVPPVVKMDAKEAIALLQRSGLQVGKVTRKITAEVTPGTVVDQQPRGGTTVERNTAVDLVVAEEPPPLRPLRDIIRDIY
jgi:serine/threonine-protein kinase